MSFRRFLAASAAFFIVLASSTAHALNCSEVRQLTLLYFKMHYSHNAFDDSLSERTLENFLKSWDPGKLYFFADDVAEIRNQYGKKLDDMVNQIDCSAIDFIVNRYSKRFEERQRYQLEAINHKFDFTKDEYMNIDRKKDDYAKTTEELNERWRQRIKFQMLGLRSSMDDDKAREKLKKRAQLAVKRHNELTKDKVLGIFLNAFSMALDPHSSFMPAEELEDFRIRTRLSLEGIGASLRSEEGFTIVASLVKGGAAEKSGLLKENDKIIGVGQDVGEVVDVIDMDLPEVVRLIRGARGTTVRLSIIRETAGGNQKLTVPIVREKIQLVDQQASSRTIHVVADEAGKSIPMKIGVINLPSFYIDFEGKHKNLKNYRSSSQDTIRELKKLKKTGLDALIVDLRNNGGGSLEESIALAGLFFDRGPVVQVKASNGDTEAYSDNDGQTYYDGPLVVMINRHSASASEIFAGAIKDYGRGLIVGDTHTFGKGTVQNLNDVAPTLGAIKVTVNQFYLPDGATTQLRGVESDIRLASLLDEYEVGEKFYDYALPFETIKSVNHQSFNLVKPYSEQLKQVSQARIASDQSFQEVFANIEKYRKSADERSRVSLKEKSKEERSKEASEKEIEDKKQASYEADKDEFHFKDDVYLQESARIAADYARMLEGKKLVKLTLPDVALAKAQADAAVAAKLNASNNKAAATKQASEAKPTEAVAPDQKGSKPN